MDGWCDHNIGYISGKCFGLYRQKLRCFSVRPQAAPILFPLRYVLGYAMWHALSV